MVFLLGIALAAGLGGGQTNSASCCAPSMAQFASDPAFLAAHFSPAPLDFKAKEGKSVTFSTATGADGGGFYVAPAPGSKAAVILVHEYWGLNDYIRKEAEKLHDETGYAVLAVDLYDGKVTTDPSEAGRLMQNAKDSRCVAILEGALKALGKGTFGFKPHHIGCVGYCFGGGWSERTAILGSSKVQACVVYYGLPDTRPASLARLKAPVLMFQAKKDQWINDGVVSNFKAKMKAAGKSLEVHAYDADHAFANPSNPHFNADAAADARSRELAFFKAHL